LSQVASGESIAWFGKLMHRHRQSKRRCAKRLLLLLAFAHPSHAAFGARLHGLQSCFFDC
jgi:hypothetical protein